MTAGMDGIIEFLYIKSNGFRATFPVRFAIDSLSVYAIWEAHLEKLLPLWNIKSKTEE